ncbi:MAG: hypothetical protein ACE5NN_00450 [Candidatus Bathyarchaeia archaeon]
MGVEKPKVEDLIKRIDELIDIFKIISEDLKAISSNLRTVIGVVKPEAPSVRPSETEETARALRTIDDTQKVFPPELVGMLYFEEADEYIIVKPRRYLGPDNFARIASIIRDQLGGEYISAGRESHFRVPRKT